jgi:hypothetical protein
MKDKIHLFSLLAGLAGAILTIFAIRELTPEYIDALAGAYGGGNIYVIENLTSQKTDILLGFSLVIVAFILEFIGFLFTDIKFLRMKKTFGITVLIYGVALLSIFLLVRPKLENKYRKDAVKVMLANKFNSYSSIEYSAEKLLNMTRMESETKEEFHKRIEKTVDFKKER